MSRWSHPICEACWIQREFVWETVVGPDDKTYEQLIKIREPSKVLEPPLETCCFCNNLTLVGIYVREDPNSDAIVACYHAKEDEEN